MFKLKSIRNQKISVVSLVQILFYTFPLSFILGNLAVSLNCVLFTLFGLFLIKKNRLEIRLGILFWLFFIFLLYFFINTLIQFKFPGLIWVDLVSPSTEDYNKFDNKRWISQNGDPTFKAFFLVRFLLLMFVIDSLFFNKIINLKNFFLSSFICATFVCCDVFLQYIFGTDIFGYKKVGAWNAGPFGDEKIATTYLKNFSFFSFFYIFNILKNKKYNSLMFVLFVTLYLLASLLGGNRMPMLILVFGCVLIILFVPSLRILMSLSLILFLGFFSLVVKNDKYFNAAYLGLLSDINVTKLFKSVENKKHTIKNFKEEEKDINNDKSEKISLLHYTGHNRIYWTAIVIWMEKPLTGQGFKSYRVRCMNFLFKDVINKKRKGDELQKITCSNHAHNYYLELLAEAGILGLSCFIIFFIVLLKDSYYFLRKYLTSMKQDEFFIIPLILIFILEIWPIQSTGSFFTSWGGTYFWLVVGILIPNVAKKK